MKSVKVIKDFLLKSSAAIENSYYKYFIAGLMLISFAISFVNAGQSLWFDELFSALQTDSALSLAQIIENTSLRDTWPPLYYIILHYVQVFFGNSEIIIRLPSIAANVLSVWFTYLLVKELYSRKEAFLACIFMVFSPFALYYSVEARGYSLFLLMSILSLYFFVRFLNNVHNKTAIYTYFFFALLCTLTHYFGLILVMLQLIYLCFNKETVKKHFIDIFIFAMIIFVYPYIHYNAGYAKTDMFQIYPASITLKQEISATGFISKLTDLFLFNAYNGIEKKILAVFFMFFLFFMKKSRSNKIILFFIISPLAVVYGISFVADFFHIRYFIFLIPLIYALTSYIFVKIFSGYSCITALVLVIFLSFNTTKLCFDKPWQSVFLRDNIISFRDNILQQDDIILYDHDTSYIEYYIKRLEIEKQSVRFRNMRNLNYEIMLLLNSQKKIYYITSMNEEKDFSLNEAAYNLKIEKIYDKIYEIKKSGD